MLALMIGVLPSTPAGSAPDARIDVLGYVISIELQPRVKAFRAVTEITLVTRAALADLRFDLVGLEVSSVMVEGAAVEFRRGEGSLIVELGRRVVAGDTLAVTVHYGGTPADGLLFKSNRYGALTVFADNWPIRARRWFPAIDDPSDKATVELRVRASPEWKVVGVGRLVSEEQLRDGSRLTVWSTDRPIPVYSMVFGAAHMVVDVVGQVGCRTVAERCVPITTWMYPKDAVRGPQLFRRAPEIVAFYDSLIGPFPYEKLALIQSSTRYGGMENASAIFFTEQIGRASSVDRLVAHEIAHQWFGDAVTPREWSHLWLSEGFATYFAAVFFEFRESVSASRQQMANGERQYMMSELDVDRPVIGEQPGVLRDLLNANNYQKGAWVLHMLRQLVGDEAFFAGVRRYYSEHRNGTALTADLQRIMEAESGQELDWFFDQWLYQPGYPELEVRYSWNAEGSYLDLTVKQVQPWPPFRIDLEFEAFFDGEGYKAQQTIRIEEREHRSLMMLPARPSRIVIDPNNELLGPVRVVP